MKKYILPIAASAILVAGVAGIAAAQTPTGSNNFGHELAQAFATRFNLNVSDVETFLTEQRAAHQAQMQEQMQAQIETHLTNAVADGKITDAQKQLILAKETEVKAKLDSFKDLDPAARKQAMEDLKTELKAWAETNGIPMNLGFGLGFRAPFGHGRGMHRPFSDAPTQ